VSAGALAIGHWKTFMTHLRSSASNKILVTAHFSNNRQFALRAEKCFASSGLAVFHLVGLK
jgi:hypothetical protein